jgi:hypothetical protein
LRSSGCTIVSSSPARALRVRGGPPCGDLRAQTTRWLDRTISTSHAIALSRMKRPLAPLAYDSANKVFAARHDAAAAKKQERFAPTSWTLYPMVLTRRAERDNRAQSWASRRPEYRYRWLATMSTSRRPPHGNRLPQRGRNRGATRPDTDRPLRDESRRT